MEGNETFIVFLSSAMNSKLGTPSQAIIVINDTADDGKTISLLKIYLDILNFK